MDLNKEETYKRIITLHLTMTYPEIIEKYKLGINKEALRQRVKVFKKTGRIVKGVKKLNILSRNELKCLIDKGLNLSEAVLQVEEILGIPYTQHDLTQSCKIHRLKFKDGRHRTCNKPPVSIPLVQILLEQKKTEVEIGLIIDRCILRTRQYIKIAEDSPDEVTTITTKKISKDVRKLATSLPWRKQA